MKLAKSIGELAIFCGLIIGCSWMTQLTAFGEQKESSKVYWGIETLEAQQLEAQYGAKKGTMGAARQVMIAACHNRSVEIGLEVLSRGGNAVDAFVATTFADYVQAPGTSSIAGPMGALVYSAKQRKVTSLVAPLKTVTNVAGQWRLGEMALGKQVLVPGAVAGLEEMHEKHGKLPWRDLVMPAAKLAGEGFAVDHMYAAIVNNYASTIKQSEYGRGTYFQADGAPLQAGTKLKLPALAETLEAIAAEGAAYVQHGAWAKEAVEVVRSAGGEMNANDLADYRPEWSEPLRISYRGREVFGLGGHDSGGVRLLLALEVLSHADIKALGHYSESMDGLEKMIRISRAVSCVASLAAQSFYDDPQAAQSLLDGSLDEDLWDDVVSKRDRTPQGTAGSHSYSIVVVDTEGNSVAGTHTIESLPFGSGLFVGGVPLNNTGILHPFEKGAPYSTPPGTYIVEPLSATFAFQDKQLVLASSTFSASLWPADFELVSSALDFDWNPERIALTPRFGGYAIDLTKLTADPSTTQLDKRFGSRVVDELKHRGLIASQAGYIDTGMLVLVRRDPQTWALTGFTPEQLPDGKAAGF